MKPSLICLLGLYVCASAAAGQESMPVQQQETVACSDTAKMQICSNAYFSNEGGDVIGDELAIFQPDEGLQNALLFDYQGEAVMTATRLQGKVAGTRLTLAGVWSDRPTEYPFDKGKTHNVEIRATIRAGTIRGTLTVDGMASTIRLKRVPQIWLCGAKLSR